MNGAPGAGRGGTAGTGLNGAPGAGLNGAPGAGLQVTSIAHSSERRTGSLHGDGAGWRRGKQQRGPAVVERRGRYAQGNALARPLKTHQVIVLIEGDGEVLQGLGADVGEAEFAVDLDPGLIETDLAQLHVGGKFGHAEGKDGGEGSLGAHEIGVGAHAELLGVAVGDAEAGAAGVNERLKLDIPDGQGDVRQAVAGVEWLHGAAAVGGQFALAQGEAAAGIVEREQESIEQLEAEQAVAGDVGGQERVFRGAHGVKVDAGNRKRVDEANGDGGAGQPGGVVENKGALPGKVHLVGQGWRDHGVGAGAGVDEEAERAFVVDEDLDVGLAVDDLHGRGMEIELGGRRDQGRGEEEGGDGGVEAEVHGSLGAELPRERAADCIVRRNGGGGSGSVLGGFGGLRTGGDRF